jgi:O-antigen ligase
MSEARGLAGGLHHPALPGWVPYGLTVVVGIAMTGALVAGKPAIYLVVMPGLAIAFAVARSPFFGLCLIALSLPLEVAGNVISITPTYNISIAWMATLMTLGSWVLDSLVSRRAPAWPRETTVLVLYLVLGIISLATAEEFDHGVEGVVHMVQTILFFMLAVDLIRDRRQLKIILTLLVAASVCSFSYALAEKFLLHPHVFQERGLDLLRPGAVTYGVEMGKVDTHGLASVARVTGTTIHSGVLALECAYMLPFIMAYLALNPSMMRQTAGWLAVLITLGAFGTTLSRSGFLTLGFTIMLLVMTGILRVTGARLIGVVLLGILGIPFLPAGFISRVLSPDSYLRSNSQSLNGRLELWRASFRAFLDHPLLGFGINNEHGIFHYWHPERHKELGTVMNTWIQIMIEVGIVGDILFTVFVAMIFWRVIAARRAYRARGEATMTMIGTAFLVLLLALVTSWMTVEFLRGGFKNIWLLLACMVAYHKLSLTGPDGPPAIRRPTFLYSRNRPHEHGDSILSRPQSG